MTNQTTFSRKSCRYVLIILASVFLIAGTSAAKSDVFGRSSYEFVDVAFYEANIGRIQRLFDRGVMDALRLLVSEKLPSQTTLDCPRRGEPRELVKLRILTDIGSRAQKGDIPDSEESAAAFRILESYRNICDGIEIEPGRKAPPVAEIERPLFLFIQSRLSEQEAYLDGVLDTVTYAQRVGAPSADFVKCLDDIPGNKPLALFLEVERGTRKMSPTEKVRRGVVRIMLDRWAEICGGFTATKKR